MVGGSGTNSIPSLGWVLSERRLHRRCLRPWIWWLTCPSFRRRSWQYLHQKHPGPLPSNLFRTASGRSAAVQSVFTDSDSLCSGLIGSGKASWLIAARARRAWALRLVSEPQGLDATDVTSHHTSASSSVVTSVLATGRRPRGSSKWTSAVIPSQGLV